MGLGLSQYIPLLFYIVGLASMVGSVIYGPVVGLLFLVPLLPYASVMAKMTVFPLGKDFLNIGVLLILIGWYLRKSPAPGDPAQETTGLHKPVSYLALASFVAFVVGMAGSGSFDIAYIVDWKDYMLLPLIWFLLTQTIRTRKALMLFTGILILGVCGVAYYFYGNLQWMNLWHFSYRVRDSVSGLFIYLGANHYGAFFVHFFFIMLGIFLFSPSRLLQVALLGMMGLTGYCLMYTFSRGAYAAFLAGLLFLGVIKDRRILIGLVLFLLFWKALVPVSVVERVEMTRTEDGQLEESAAERVMLWDHAMEMFQSSPLFGHGFNVFTFAGFNDPHNYYLKMLAEQGVMGIAAFLYLLFAAFKVGWALYQEADDWFFQGLGLGFATCMVAVMVTNFFGNRWSYLSLGSYLWAFMGLTTAALLINRREKAALPPGGVAEGDAADQEREGA